MSVADSHAANGLSDLAQVEKRLAISLSAAAEEIARSECFDDEQRSEIYAILDAIRSDVSFHENAVGCWIRDDREPRDV